MLTEHLFKISQHIFYGIFLSLFFLVGQAQATVTIDNISSGGASDTISGITSLSWSHTVNTCTNCVLYVGVSTYTQTNVATERVLNVTYGAQTLTSVGTQVSPVPTLPAAGNSSVELFRLIAPSVGTATVTVTFIVSVNYAVGGTHSLNGVSQTTPNSAFFSSSGNSSTPAVSVSGEVNGDLVLDVLGTTPNAVFVAPHSSQTSSYNGRGFFSNAFDIGAGSNEPPPLSPTLPMSWTMSNSAVWALGAIVVKQQVTTGSLALISGQVRTKSGEEINDAVVILQNLTTGEELRVGTDKKGFYKFEELEVGWLYRVRVINKKYRFPNSERIVNLLETVENIDFIGTVN